MCYACWQSVGLVGGFMGYSVDLFDHRADLEHITFKMDEKLDLSGKTFMP
ncbi:MAG: hypothetical protein OXC44_05635 [Proteobacteria bacterium]|nr:hypothetical protein [Pseudomonadota bacterium]